MPSLFRNLSNDALEYSVPLSDCRNLTFYPRSVSIAFENVLNSSKTSFLCFRKCTSHHLVASSMNVMK